MQSASLHLAMPPVVIDNYREYLALGSNRSLKSVARRSGSPSIATLKRWSVRYDWRNLVAVYDKLLAKELAKFFEDQLKELNRPNVLTLTVAKQAFYNRVADDIQTLVAAGKNPNRFLKITVQEYIRLVRLERELHAEALRNKIS